MRPAARPAPAPLQPSQRLRGSPALQCGPARYLPNRWGSSAELAGITWSCPASVWRSKKPGGVDGEAYARPISLLRDLFRDAPALHIASGASPPALDCAQQPGGTGRRAHHHTRRQRRPLAAAAHGRLFNYRDCVMTWNLIHMYARRGPSFGAISQISKYGPWVCYTVKQAGVRSHPYVETRNTAALQHDSTAGGARGQRETSHAQGLLHTLSPSFWARQSAARRACPGPPNPEPKI